MYREYPIRPDLRWYIRRIWSYAANCDEPDVIDTIAPDGCPEIIAHLGHVPVDLSAPASSATEPHVEIVGQLTGPLRLCSPGRVHMFAARLQPYALPAFTGVPARLLTDESADAGAFGLSRPDLMIASMGDAANDEQRAALFQHWLSQHIQPERNDRVIAWCADRLEHQRCHMDELMQICGLSARQLERRFLSTLGLPPRFFASLTRFARLQTLATTGGRWSDHALAAGYYDQAHMIRDYRRFTGSTPTRFESERGYLSAAMV